MQDDTAGFDPVVAPADQPMPGAPAQQPAQDEVAAAPGQREPAAKGGTFAEDGSSARVRRPLERAPFNQNYRYTQEDFYGTGNPNITWTDARGVQMYVPQAGKLPMSIWASQMQQAQGELAKTRKAIADLLDATKAPKTAPPYQQDFNRLFYGIHNNQISALEKQYGDRTLALKEIATPGTMANMEYRRTMADAQALASFINYGWEDAADWIKQVSEGKYEPYPQMRKNAQDVLSGIGSMKSDKVTGGDVGKLVRSIGMLKKDMALARFTEEFLKPNAAIYYAKAKEILSEQVRNGQRRVETLTEQNIADEFYSRMADEYARFAPGADKKYAEDFFRAMFPATKEHLHDVDYRNLPEGRSGGGGAGNMPTGMTAAFKVRKLPFSMPMGGAWKSMLTGIYVPASYAVGNRMDQIKEANVYSPSRGQTTKMLNPMPGFDPGGKAVIRGLMADQATLSRLSELETKRTNSFGEDESDPDAFSRRQKINKEIEELVAKGFKEESVPLKDNEDFLRVNYGYNTVEELFAKMLGITPEEVKELASTEAGMRDLAAMTRGEKPKAAAPKQKKAGTPVLDGSNL